jgi:hypothetical protein
MIVQDLKLDYDCDLVVKEILSCKEFFVDIPPYKFWLDLAKKKKIFMVETDERYDSITMQDKNQITTKIIKPPQSFYIKSSDLGHQPYSKSKKTDFRKSYWNTQIEDRLTYTKKLLDKLPFEYIGLVRVFILENTFLPTHQDRITSDVNSHLGLSLVPIHSGTPLMIYNPRSGKIESTFSNCFLFDDSYLHGIPMVHGLRIDIRIFGKLKNSLNIE